MPGNYAEFGPEASGARLAELDHAADISNSMKSLMMFSQMAENDAQMPLYRAQARKAGAEAGKLEADAAAQKDMAAFMAGRGGGDGSGNLAYDAADFMAGRGMVDSATKFLLRGAQTESAQATRDWRDAEVKTQGLVQQRNQFSLLGSLASNVTDQPSFDRMLATAQSMNLPIEGIPTDYESAKAGLGDITKRATTVIQQINAEISKQRLELEKTTAAGVQRARDKQIQVADKRIQLLDERYKAAVKYGGERSAEAQTLKREKIETEKVRRGVINSQTAGLSYENPKPLPLANGKANEDALKSGQFYSNSKGQVGRWNGKAMELVQPTRQSAPAPEAALADDEEGDDDADE